MSRPGGGLHRVPTMQPPGKGLPGVTKVRGRGIRTGDTFMTTSHRRIALLTGASISALGVSSIFAAPALAAPHDAPADGTYAGTSTTDHTVTICDLATDTGACFFGVI